MKTRNAVPWITVSGPFLDELVFSREKDSQLILRTNPQPGSAVSV